MSIEAVLISSPTLRSQSSVLGSVPTLGFKIAPFINHYQVTHFVDLDLSDYPMQLLSSPVKLMEVDLNSLEKEPLKVCFRGFQLHSRASCYDVLMYGIVCNYVCR